jgi:hypothetical protein
MGGSGPPGNYQRALVLSVFFFSCAIGLGPFIIIAAIVLHRGALGFAVVLGFVSLNALAQAAAVAIKIQYVLAVGYWSRRDGTRIQRSDAPSQYRSRFLWPAVELAINAAGAVVLGYMAFYLAHLVPTHFR